MSSATHNSAIIPVAAARFVERFAYYGVRSILVLYLVHILKLPKEDVYSKYAIFTLIAGSLSLFGGLIGDFILGSWRSSLLGLALEAVGCFILCIPSVDAAVAGLLMIALGAGIYSPNSISQIGILYKNKKSLLDAAVIIFYIAVNFGAFLAPWVIADAGEKHGYTIGFIVAGIALIISFCIQLFSKDLKTQLTTKSNFNAGQDNVRVATHNVLGVIALFFLVPLFWVVFEKIGNELFTLGRGTGDTLNFSRLMMANPFLTVLLGIGFAFLWTYAKVSSFLKIFFGYLIVLVILFFFSLGVKVSDDSSLLLFFVAVIFLQALAEMLISPIALAFGLRFFPPKIIATLTAIFLIITSLVPQGVRFILSRDPDIRLTPTLEFVIVVVSAAIFLILFLASRKQEQEFPAQN
jgi:proton-dependent oligopeptide transporter, POT family